MDAAAAVIVNYRTPEMTLDCIAALAKERTLLPNLRAVIVDGGSNDGSADKIRAGIAGHNWIELLAMDFNGGFGWANNQGMLHLLQGADPPDFIHLLNPDAVITPGAVSALRDFLGTHPKCAAAGSQLLNDDGSEAGSAFRFPSVTREFFRGAQMNRVGRALGLGEGILRPKTAAPVDWVTGASVMLRSEALCQVGLFDTGFFLYYEEVELMYRLKRARWQVWFVPGSRVMHVGGVATGMANAELHERASIPDYMFASRRRFFTRAYGPKVARGATLAWLAGNRLLRTAKGFGLLKSRPVADAERTGMLRYGAAASKADRSSAVTRCDDPLNVLPAWHQPS